MTARFGAAVAMAASLAWDPSVAWPLLAINAIGSSISGATVPARRALNADVVPKEHLTNAVAMEEFSVVGGFLLGPIVAGVLLLSIDLDWLIAGAAALFFVGATLVSGAPQRSGRPAGVPRREEPAQTATNMEDSDASTTDEAAQEGVLRMFLDGLALAWSIPVIRASLAMSFLLELLVFNYFSILPIYATKIYGGGPATLGSLESTVSLGEVLGGFVIAWIGVRLIRTGRWFVIGVMVTTVLAIPLAFNTSLAVAYGLVFALGATAAFYSVLSTRVLIQTVPGSARGRLFGVQQMTWGGGAIGGLMTGGLAALFSPAIAVGSLAIVGLAAIVVIAAMSSSLRQVTTVSELDDESADG